MRDEREISSDAFKSLTNLILQCFVPDWFEPFMLSFLHVCSIDCHRSSMQWVSDWSGFNQSEREIQQLSNNTINWSWLFFLVVGNSRGLICSPLKDHLPTCSGALLRITLWLSSQFLLYSKTPQICLKCLDTLYKKGCLLFIDSKIKEKKEMGETSGRAKEKKPLVQDWL